MDVQCDTKVENFPACSCESQTKGRNPLVQPARVEDRQISETDWRVRSQTRIINSDTNSPNTNPLFRHLLYPKMPGSKSPLNMGVQRFLWQRATPVIAGWLRAARRDLCSFGLKVLDPLKMGPIGCPETSVRIYHYSLREQPGSAQISCTSRWKSEFTTQQPKFYVLLTEQLDIIV